MEDFLLNLAVKLVFGAIASIGFAILFNVPVYRLWLCGFCGALGIGLRTCGLAAGGSLEMSTLFGSLAVGFAAYAFHKRLSMPTHIISIPGTINMVPGVLAFKAMTGFMQFATTHDPIVFLEASHHFLEMAYVVLAISFGLVLPSLCFRIEKRTL
ncbi:threonine/serine exporter family protein [Desulfovibrio inopinatus]|uniref:threonine/serine exporter family protein n=1 Tax=Desulfovibrio inopinatus TaxID=102109 RepID=UPI00048712D2|nr:threonine/serine exporter family protein [Desulfovibrio inopinatus]